MEIAAGQEILLTSGGGYIRLKGGNIEVHCPGEVSIKGASHKLSGPASIGVNMQGFPSAERYDEQFRILGPTGKPLSGLMLAISDGQQHCSSTPGRTAAPSASIPNNRHRWRPAWYGMRYCHPKTCSHRKENREMADSTAYQANTNTTEGSVCTNKADCKTPLSQAQAFAYLRAPLHSHAI